MPGNEPHLLRALLAADGRVKANFSDNTVLLLDSTGSTFTVSSPDGKQQRQLSAYAVSCHERKLAAVLEFRNTHLEIPYSCKAFRLVAKKGFQTGYPIRYADWASSCKAAASSGLLNLEESGAYALRSEDDTARAVLSPHAQRLSVTFPLLVEEAAMHHKFVWHTQVFWCRECPRRWAPVQRILFEAAGAEEPQHLRQEDEDQGPGKRTRTELPRALVGGSAADAGAWADFPPGSWWFECSTTLMPSDCTMLVEWRPEATYHYCSREREALVVIHQDGSTMETFKLGSYLRHFRSPERLGTHVYAADAVPRLLRNNNSSSSSYELSPIAAHARLFREAAARLATQPSSRDHQLPSDCLRPKATAEGGGLSTSVKDIRDEPGIGRFTSYEDGRVRVVFRDRTILEMDGSRSTASVIFPDASSLKVNVSNPVGVEHYVMDAQRFASWSFSSVEERLSAHRMQQALQAELERTGRMQDLLSWAIDGTLPPGARAGGATLVEEPMDHGASFDRGGGGGSKVTFEGEDLAALVEQYMESNRAMLERLNTSL